MSAIYKKIILQFGFWGLVLMPIFANAADMYVVLDKSQVPAQGTFTGTIYVSTGGVAINNAESTLHFPTDKLSVESISTLGSIFNIWVEQPSFSNSAGTVYFNGGLPTPGYAGQAGKSIQINFKAKAPGEAALTLGTSAIRANDGLGTNVLAQARGASVAIGAASLLPIVPTNLVGAPKAPVIFSKEAANQEVWINKTTDTFSWDLPEDVTAVQLVLSRSADTIPSIVYEPPIETKTLNDLTDGTLFLNARFKNSVGWGKIASRKIKIDTAEPTDLIAKWDETNTDRVSISASANDGTSGLKGFSVYESGDKIYESKQAVIKNQASQLELGPLTEGEHELTVRAFDYAGNYTETKLSVEAPEIKAPKITHYPETVKIGSEIEIRGKSAYPESEISVWIKEENGEEKNFVVKSDEDKIFAFTSDAIGAAGTVSIRTETILTTSLGKKIHSKPSQSVYVSVKESGVIRIGTRAIQIISITITALLLLFILSAMIYFGIRKLNAMKRKIRADLVHTEQEVHKVFEILKGDTKRHIRMLDRARGKRKLTREENTIFTELNENLADTEQYLSAKIKKIEKEDL